MSVDTHINTYIQDVEDAEKEVLAAFGKYKTAIEALKTKYATHIGEIAHAVGMSVPEVEALVPQAAPVVKQAEEDAQKAADEVAKLEQTAKGSSSSAKS